jgi:Tfp pilus assembly protein PilN
MRPINLIPPEERRGDNAPLRTGPMPYVLLAALVALLVGVAALVLTNNEVGERKGEVAKLEGEDAVAAARAQRLSVYTNFRSMSEARVQTVSELADSRFDWERVMRELSLILPKDVWLVGLTATASSSSGVEGGGGGGGMRASIPGPALELSGCAKGQEGVAGFVTALKDIDGVTRVGVETSELGEEGKSEGGGGSSSGSSSSSQCRTRDYIAEFQIVAAFDAAPAAEASEGSAVAPTAETTAADAKESTEGSAESAGGE